MCTWQNVAFYPPFHLKISPLQYHHIHINLVWYNAMDLSNSASFNLVASLSPQIRSIYIPTLSTLVWMQSVDLHNHYYLLNMVILSTTYCRECYLAQHYNWRANITYVIPLLLYYWHNVQLPPDLYMLTLLSNWNQQCNMTEI